MTYKVSDLVSKLGIEKVLLSVFKKVSVSDKNWYRKKVSDSVSFTFWVSSHTESWRKRDPVREPERAAVGEPEREPERAKESQREPERARESQR